MSDTPLGGWWKAKDGKWYPPETHPDHAANQTIPEPAGPPAEGWWQASDGNWYPPESHPEHIAGQAPAETAASGPLIDASASEAPWAGPPADETAVAPGGTVDIDLTEETAPLGASPGLGAAAVGGAVAGGELAGGVQAPDARRGFFDLVPEDDPQVGLVDDRRPLFTGPGAPPEVSNGAPADLTPPDVVAPTHAETVPAADAFDAPPAESSPFDAPGFPPPTSLSDPVPPKGSTGDAAGRPPSDRRKLLLIAGGAAAVILLGVLAAVFLLGRGGDDETADTATTVPDAADEPATSAPATTAAPSTTSAPTTTVAADPPDQVSGRGAATVDIGREVTDPYLALVTHDGPGSVLVELLDADGAVVDQLVGPGVSGQYLGVLPVNFTEGQSFSSVRFTGEGPWAVTFALTSSAPIVPTAPGSTYRSDSDRVVGFAAADDTRIRVICDACSTPLAIVPWSPGDTEQPESLSLEGGVMTVPAGTTSLQITAQGSAGVLPAWSITVL